MANYLHILNRDGVFYWRRRLPAAMVTAFGRSQLLISMKVREPRAAQRLARRLSVQFDHFLQQMTLEHRLPTKAEQDRILQKLYQQIIDDCREELVRHHAPGSVTPELLSAGSLPEEDFASAWFKKDQEKQTYYLDPAWTADALRGGLADNLFAGIRFLLTPALADHGIDANTNSIAFRKFLHYATHIAVRAFEDAQREQTGAQVPAGLEELIEKARATEPAPVLERSTSIAAPAIPPTSSVAASPVISTSRPISVYAKAFLKGEEGHVTDGTKGQKSAALDLLIGILGDIPADSIKREDAVNLHRTLQRVPAQLSKSSNVEMVAFDKGVLQNEPGPETMAISTLKRHWRDIRGFYKYVNVQDDIRPIDLERIFGQMRWDPRVKPEQPRKKWTDKAIERLFSSPIWSGFEPHPKKRYWRYKAGGVIVKDEYWWLPLLGLYQGGRLEEFCQLKGRDIKTDEETGILYLDFHKGMRLKNKASARRVPVHSTILRLGLRELASTAGSELLFPRLTPAGRDNKLGHDYSQEFKPYREAIGVYEPRMDFHSFRRNFTTQLVKHTLVIARRRIDWARFKGRNEIKDRGGSMTLRYYEGNLMTALKATVDRVVYPQIDIEGLVAQATAADPAARSLKEKHPVAWGDRTVVKERRVRARPSRSEAAE